MNIVLAQLIATDNGRAVMTSRRKSAHPQAAPPSGRKIKSKAAIKATPQVAKKMHDR